MPGLEINRLKFLVIDDSANIRALIRKMLGELGVKDVADASDGAEGFDLLRTYRADIVICDIAMQPVDGIEFLKRVRHAKDSPDPFVPVMMLTVHTAKHMVQNARDGGANDFLAKPVTVRSLYAHIQDLIEHPRPFVRTGEYFGPDRRRKQVVFKGPNRRVAQVWAQSPERQATGFARRQAEEEKKGV